MEVREASVASIVVEGDCSAAAALMKARMVGMSSRRAGRMVGVAILEW